MKTFVFDLDHTLCIPQLEHKDTYRRYALAQPMYEMIQQVRRLHDGGHQIIIHTARRMLTFRGDVALIEKDVGKVTRDWLTFHNVPYHQLVFGKPYGDFYVDDKNVLLASLPTIVNNLVK